MPPCDVLHPRKGGVTILCTRGRRREPKPCSVCKIRTATLLCDGPRSGKKPGTCDAPLCERCTTREEKVLHFAPWSDTHDLCPECSASARRARQMDLGLQR